MVDFDIPVEAREVRDQVARFIDECVLPAEEEVGERPYFDLVAQLQEQARSRGLWCPIMAKEWGGMGLSHVANALVQLEVGRSFTHLGAWALNCMSPQDATMLTLIEHGTDAQRERYLKPLIEGTLRICFSMTERAAGADATGLRTTAEKRDDEWILNGEKWFTSGASISQLALVMARTESDGPRHRQFSTFLVELPNPGYRIVRDIPTMADAYEKRYANETVLGHAEVAIENLVVPDENLLGGRGAGFSMGQHRLGYGRLRGGMWNLAMAQQALDLVTKRVIDRETFGSRLADRQGVQWMLADCAEKIYLARLLVLHIAYKMDRGLDLSQENSIAKNYFAHMIEDVLDTALQLHGSLGYSLDVPLAEWSAQTRQARIADGPDEVHRWTVGRNVVRAYERNGTTAAATGGDLF